MVRPSPPPERDWERTVAALRRQEEDLDEENGGVYDDEERFLNLQFLSHIAVKVRDDVPRALHVKGCIGYAQAFTGKDMVSTIQGLIQRDLMLMYGFSTNDRRLALQIARSLQSQLWFYDVEYSGRPLCDDVDDLYRFPGDAEDSVAMYGETLPTGVNALLTPCYSISCEDGRPCYSISCPFRLVRLFPYPRQPVMRLTPQSAGCRPVRHRTRHRRARRTTHGSHAVFAASSVLTNSPAADCR